MSAQPVDSGPEWEPLKPLDKLHPPAMPLEVLPPVLRNMAETVAEAVQGDPSLAVVMGLGAAAALAQKTVKVQARPVWKPEPVSLFVFAVADVSERKTPTYDYMAGPLHDLEAELEERGRTERLMRNERRINLEEQRKALRRQAAKGGEEAGAQGTEAEIAQLAAELEELGPEEGRPRIVMDITTPEELVSKMAQNRGRIAVMSPEGAVVHVLAGAYSGNGQPADVSALLSAYSGKESITVDRKHRQGESIRHPALTMVLVGQPALFASFCGIKDAEERGVLARFMVVHVPPRWPRFAPKTDSPDPEETAEGRAWLALLRSLAARAVSDSPPVLRLSPEARTLFDRWHDELELERGPEDGLWSSIRGYAGKAHGLALRLAGLFHLCSDPDAQDGDLIDVEKVERACQFVDWSLEAHKAAAVGLRLSEPARNAHRALKAAAKGTLSRSRPPRRPWGPFIETDVRQALGGSNSPMTNEQAIAALDILKRNNHIRWSEEYDAYEWHPDLAAGGER